MQSFFENSRREVLSSQGNYLCPLTLDRGDILKFRQMDWWLVEKRHVRAQEVVVGHKQGGEGHRAVVAVKAGGRSDVVLIGSV